MIYWMPKFKNLSPWTIAELPDDALELAKLAVERITSVDRLTDIRVYDAKDIPESVDKTWVVSGQSPSQRQLITQWPKVSNRHRKSVKAISQYFLDRQRLCMWRAVFVCG